MLSTNENRETFSFILLEKRIVKYYTTKFKVKIILYLQIGRSSDSNNDFLVTDTVPGSKKEEDGEKQRSTISRYACRIVVERNPPYVARVFAAGKLIFYIKKITEENNVDKSGYT